VVGVPVGLEPGDLLAAGAGHDGEDLVVLVEDAQHGVLDLDSDGGAGVAKADRLALADDLDAAAAGDPALDPAVTTTCQPRCSCATLPTQPP